MNLHPEHYIIVSQSALGTCMFGCLLLIPRYFFSTDQGGISNYGIESRTTGLYAVGFIAAAAGALLAGLKLPADTPRRTRMRLALFSLSVLYVLSLLSTYQYKSHAALHVLHYAAGIVLFIGMSVLAAWLRFVGAPDAKTKRAFIVFGIGFLAATLTFFGFLHILFTAQIISGSSFAYILIHGVSTLSHSQPD